MAWRLGDAGIYSDDFYDGSLQAHWSVKTETGCSNAFEGSGTSNARLNLTMDATSHTMDSDLEHYFIYQSASDSDFEIEVAFDQLVTATGTECGILVEDADRSDMTILGFYDNTDGEQRVYSARRDAGTFEYDPTWGDDISLGYTAADVPFRLRMVRSGDNWSMWYKEGAASETSLTTSEAHAFTVDKVGIYIANFTNDNADTAKCDWFFENGAPIVSEDTTYGLINGRRIFIV